MFKRCIATTLLAGTAFAFTAAPAGATLTGVSLNGGGFIDDQTTGDPNDKASVAAHLPCPGAATADVQNPGIVARFGRAGAFRLQTLTESECTLNDPNGDIAGGVLEGTGTGTCNGEAANVTFGFGDSVDVRGLGVIDAVDLQIDGSAPGCRLLLLSGVLEGGNLVLRTVAAQ